MDSWFLYLSNIASYTQIWPNYCKSQTRTQK